MSAMWKRRREAPSAWSRLLAFLGYLEARFEADQCTRAAASLAYTSLLALVPLFTVIFVALSAFPAFRAWQATIEQFVFSNFVPAFGDQIQSYLLEFTDKARGLQAAGIVVLVVTVLAMLSTIESTFNVIWGIHRRRPLLTRFLVYWAVLTLGPLLIGAGMVATTHVISLPLLASHGVSDDMKTNLVEFFPVFATTVAFVFFFKLIPYRPVPLRNALVGGVIASVLFEVAKRAFAEFVTQFPSQQAVYGAFATVPIFLAWLYLSWIIVLLGAEITQCLTTFGALGRARTAVWTTHDPLYAAYRVLLQLYRAQSEGRGLSDGELIDREPDCGYPALNAALESLDAAAWISRDDDYQWILMRDLGRVSLRDLLRLAPSFITVETLRELGQDAADQRLMAKLDELENWSGASLATPLAELLDAPAVPMPAPRQET